MHIVPVAVVMGTIFFLSHQPGTELELPPIPALDKVAHAVMYALLAAAAIYAVPQENRRTRPKQTCWLVILFCLFYGMSDEFHQTFIPGREASFGDIAADLTGAALLVFLWRKKYKPGSAKAATDQVAEAGS